MLYAQPAENQPGVISEDLISVLSRAGHSALPTWVSAAFLLVTRPPPEVRTGTDFIRP